MGRRGKIRNGLLTVVTAAGIILSGYWGGDQGTAAVRGHIL